MTTTLDGLRVCMLLRNDFRRDLRVRREARTLADAGCEVTVVTVGRPAGPRAERYAEGRVSVVNIGTVRGPGVSRLRSRVKAGTAPAARPAATHVAGRATVAPSASVVDRPPQLGAFARLLWFGRRWLEIRALVRAGRAVEPDVVHCHEMNTLIAGRLLARATGAALVYDSHELEADRASRVNRPWARRWARLEEAALIRGVDATIAVSGEIARYLQACYRVRPVVLRNLPDEGLRHDAPGADVPRLRALAGAPDDHTIVLYQGGLQSGRGLEALVDAVPMIDERADVVILGPGSLGPALERRAADLGVDERVTVLPPVPPDVVSSLTEQADVGMCAIEDIALSYHWALPNKLFEYLEGGLPVVASDLPELARVVLGEDVGVLCEPGDARSMAAAINTLVRDPARRAWCAEHARAAAPRYRWSVEAPKLVALYEDVAARRRR